jgi:Fic family protein
VYYSYKKLWYRIGDKEEFQKALNNRLNYLTPLPLLSKKGEPLHYFDGPEIQKLITDVEAQLKQLRDVEEPLYMEHEAYATSVIEGARITVADTVRLNSGDTPKNKDERMASNSLKTLKSMKNVDITHYSFDKYKLRSLWETLTYKACDNEEIAGVFYRSGPIGVSTGTKQTFLAPREEDVPEMMEILFSFIRGESVHPPMNNLVKAIVVHYYFAYVHPFCDGNGRMARMLLTQYLLNSGYHIFDKISISTEVNKRRKQYYEALENSENELNDITFFIEYYLRVMALVLRKAARGFGVRFDEVLGVVNHREGRAIRYLYKEPSRFLTHASYAKMADVSKGTANKELKALFDSGILVREYVDDFYVYKWWEYSI